MGFYGVAINCDGNSNTTIGQFGNPGNRVSFRERIDHTGSISAVCAYLQDGSGYSLGTGGILRLTIQTDDGTSNHRPSGTVLATKDLTPGNPLSVNPAVWTLTTPLAVTSGDLLHFVWTNVAADPVNNWTSVNGIDLEDVPTPAQPSISDIDRILMIDLSTGTFNDRHDRYPILDIRYVDGYHGGQAFFQSSRTAGQQEIAGTLKKTRMNFTPLTTQVLSAVQVKLGKQAGTTQPLVLNLRTIGGTLLGSVSIPAASVPGTIDAGGLGTAWTGGSFASPVTVSAGTNYYCECTSPGETVAYRMFPIQSGGTVFGLNFQGPNKFDEGLFEYTTNNSTWVEDSSPGGKPMMYFTTVDSVANYRPVHIVRRVQVGR